MELLRRKRKKPPIKAYGPPALHTVTITLTESWVQTNDSIREERTGPSYRWKVQLTHGYRLGLVHSFSTTYRTIRVSGGSINSIELQASGSLHPARLKEIRRFITMAQAASITESQQPATT